jgi:hypothetical protein
MTVTVGNDILDLRLSAEATERGVVAPWLHDFVDGVKDSATSKHIKIDDDWFAESLAEPIGTLEAHVPLAAFRRSRG